MKHSSMILLSFSIPQLLGIHGVGLVQFLLEFDVGDHQLFRVAVIAMRTQLCGVLNCSYHPLFPGCVSLLFGGRFIELPHFDLIAFLSIIRLTTRSVQLSQNYRSIISLAFLLLSSLCSWVRMMEAMSLLFQIRCRKLFTAAFLASRFDKSALFLLLSSLLPSLEKSSSDRWVCLRLRFSLVSLLTVLITFLVFSMRKVRGLQQFFFQCRLISWVLIFLRTSVRFLKSWVLAMAGGSR